MKKTLLSLFALFITTMAFAYNAQIDGIYYNFVGKNAIVTHDAVVDHETDNNAGYTQSEIVIPEKVTYNGKEYSVTSIGDKAFIGCSSITSITIPNNVTSIENTAFYGCSSLTAVQWNVKKMNDFDPHSAPFNDICSQIISFTFGDSVEYIPAYLCCNMSKLTSITIPNSVTSIGVWAFNGTLWLENQPDGCVYINNYLYVYKGEMPENTHIDIKEGTTQICGAAFGGCSSLTSITIPNSVTTIGNRAFYLCTSLTSVTMGNSVTSIGGYAFYDCIEIISIEIPNTIKEIGMYAFENCTGLTSITIPNSVTSIGKGMFLGCSGLKSITIGNGVTKIDEQMFSNCTGLTSIAIGSGITSIDKEAFEDCSSLASVKWNAKRCNDFSSEEILFATNPITSFTFGDDVERIPAYLCYNKTDLSSIVIPNLVTEIGASAFQGCNKLRTVEIGKGITSIGDKAFAGCSAIYSMGIDAIIPPIVESSTFNNVSRTTQIKVPCSAVAAYQASSYWNEFTNYVETPYTLVVNTNDNTMGNAIVVKQPTCQDISAQVQAQALPGYEFVKWSDGFTENPHTVFVTSDTIITAEFRVASSTPVENTYDSNVKIYANGGNLHIEGITEDYQIFDAFGRMVYIGRESVLSLPRGVYVVVIGNEVQKVVL